MENKAIRWPALTQEVINRVIENMKNDPERYRLYFPYLDAQCLKDIDFHSDAGALYERRVDDYLIHSELDLSDKLLWVADSVLTSLIYGEEKTVVDDYFPGMVTYHVGGIKEQGEGRIIISNKYLCDGSPSVMGEDELVSQNKFKTVYHDVRYSIIRDKEGL